MNKVFCIGFQKTGTTTLGKALEALGYHHTSFNRDILDVYRAGQKAEVLEYMNDFESADDAPWNKIDMIPLLYEAFPNSRFVYLHRDEELWKQSVVNWSLKKRGVEANIDGYLKDYRAHHDFVNQFFTGEKSSALLRIDVSEPGSFNKLKVFLGFAPGEAEFSHHNKTALLRQHTEVP